MIDIAKKVLESNWLFVWLRSEWFGGEWVYSIFVRAESGTYTFAKGAGTSEAAAVMMLIASLLDSRSWDYWDDIPGRLSDIKATMQDIISEILREILEKKGDILEPTAREIEGELQKERMRLAEKIDDIDDKISEHHDFVIAGRGVKA